MDTQLRLLPQERRATPPWQIDESTREIGREGVAKARAALRRARPEPAQEVDAHAPAA